MRILHLEDSTSDSFIIERSLIRHGLKVEIVNANSTGEFLEQLNASGFDFVLVDNSVPSFSARDAVALSKARLPDVPVIVYSGAAREADVQASSAAGASDFVLKDHLWQLVAALRRAPLAQLNHGQLVSQNAAAVKLVAVVQELSLAQDLRAIIEIVRVAARQLTGADGATFVMRDGDLSYYVDEDAIAPLWKGQRFPLRTCISGWVMINGRSVIISDIYADPRIPADAYRPTFVKSLAMVPVRPSAPLAAIGNYWRDHHECTPEELMVLEALANSTAVAIEAVRIRDDLEHRVQMRTRELQTLNDELEAFVAAVSHDLRAPLRAMRSEIEVMSELNAAAALEANLSRLREQEQRLSTLITDLMRLSQISRAELVIERVDLSAVARSVMARLQAARPDRSARVHIDDDILVDADMAFMAVALENLLDNAWKYTANCVPAVISLTAHLTAGGDREIRIADNDVGFDERFAHRLFKPFQRLHSQAEFPGTGIGLATVQRIITRHGGRVWARSAPDQGASFCLTIPRPGRAEPPEGGSSA